MALFHWIFMALGFGFAFGLAFACLFMIQYLNDAGRYRWLRDHPATFVADDAISRWLLRRPYGSEEFDAVVDAGIRHVDLERNNQKSQRRLTR